MKMKKFNSLIGALLGLILLISGCDTTELPELSTPEPTLSVSVSPEPSPTEAPLEKTEEPISQQIPDTKTPSFDLNSIPAYSQNPYIAVNGNIPYFTESDYTVASFENYSPLDSLGRCGTAFANIGKDIMPVGERGAIGSVKPTGWHTVKYDNVDGKYLYNRCHLIGYQLSGENANTKNLITGTRYMNVTGMLPFENMVADYVKETNNHVLYRVTPVFEGNNLLASGVLMEALSMEDKGEGICFNVFCYNVQPGININYSTGDSSAALGSAQTESKAETVQKQSEAASPVSDKSSYIGNKNTKKFHYPTCRSVKQMKEANKDYMTCTRDEAISKGYNPCGICQP